MKLKNCKKCLENKPLNEFNKGNDPKDNLNYNCKLCQKIINKNYRDSNKDKYKEWVKNNPNKIKEKNDKYLKSEKSKLRRANHYQENQEVIKQNSKKYYDENKDKVKARQHNYVITGKVKEYRDKIKHIIAWRNLLNNSLKRLGQNKEDKTIKLLGYSALELKNYIESLFTEEMSWENYGEWHIDHIKPVVSFDKDIEVRIVNSLSNLRPMWATTREINGVVYEGNLNRKKY